jgi:GT2 family glycosyltransferase
MIEGGRLAAIVLNYETPQETFLAARSLIGSRRSVQDLIVVDNGSNDGSEALLRDWLPVATIVQTGANLGFSGGCNVGIREALRRGAELILLANSDVVVAPDALAQLEDALRAHPAAGIAGPTILVRSEPDRVESMGIRFSPVTGRMRHHDFGRRLEAGPPPMVREVDGVSGCVMLVRREVFEHVGLLTEDYFFSFEDIDFCLRARRAGFVTICVGAARVYHEGGRSIGSRSLRRNYFATRNHLLMAGRVAPENSTRSMFRAGAIVALGLAHVLLRADVPAVSGVLSVLRGAWHHVQRRYGDDR